MFLLLIALTPSIKATTTCNSFPKIFGGSSGNSYLYQIDVYNDYLAMGGHTFDNTLAGIAISNSRPYVALQSISTGGKIYWAKELSSKISSSIFGVQFSTDGALLILHGYSSTSFIVVFSVSSGNVKSARRYSTSGFVTYSSLINSMLVSSGASPMAYVLSNYYVGSSCPGQHIFKFDPLTFSTAAVWIKQTLGTNNCGHLGLVFGRSDLFLYAFSWYNGLSTVSLLDTEGNSQWQYSTPEGYSSMSNSISYLQIDVSTDMVIATSGQSFINYNIIISSTALPYSVSSSQTLRDPTSSTTRQLFGIYIKDQNNAVSLIYDSSTRYTDLATINFAAPSISYQRAFPEIQNMRTAVFTSPTLYYAGVNDYQFYTNQVPPSQDLSPLWEQSIVYSQDTTLTSCYSMAPIVTSTPITMTSPLTTITLISSSIYGLSTVSFFDDITGCTTYDIIQGLITSINSWCPYNILGPFTVNPVTQANSTFTLKSKISKQFSITPFSASTTQNCCPFATTWTYSGFNNSDGNALNAATDLISVDPVTGAINVSNQKSVGTYQIKVIGTLPDLVTTFSANFTIIITPSDPPYFTGEKPQNQKVMINTELFYPLPPFKDPEGSSVTISVYPIQANTFVSIQDKTLKFAPKFSFQVRTTQITIILTNEEKSTYNSSFNVTVFSRPEFTEILQKQNIAILSSTNYTLPVNLESKFYVIHPKLPHFVYFEYPDYFFNPQKLNDIGIYIINGELCDENAKTQFQFQVNVTNQAPYLIEGKISDLRVPIKSEYTLNFSEGVDREGQKIAYEANERNKQVLPSFIKFNRGARQFKIQPTKLDAIKDYHIELSLIDDFGARTMYPFVVSINNPPQLFQNANNNTKSDLKQLPKNYLSAKIQSINPYGLIVIKFYETLETPLLINNASLKFNSTNIDVQLKPFQDQNQQNQNKSQTQWQAINLTTTELTIQVNFSDPAQISPKISQEDKIEITFKDGEMFKGTKGGKCLPDNYVLISGLPRQIVLTKQIASISEMISSGSKAMTYLVIGNVALQLFMSFSMHLLWGMMNNLQLMAKMLKFNVNVPSNAYIFFKYIEEFLSMKAKFIEDYLEKFNNYIMRGTGTSGQSDKDGNSSVIKNLGTIIIGSVVLAIAMILTAILIKYSRIPLIMKITNALKNKLFFNSILRTGVQSYMQFSIIAFASLDSRKDYTNLAIGILFVCLTVCFLFFAHIFLRKNLSQLSEPTFQQRFNSLYLNIDTDIPHSYFLTTIFLLRRFLLGIVLSFGDDHQDAQFFYMNFTSFLVIIYLVKVRPLQSNYFNTIEILNEMILYGCTGLIWGMTDYQGDWPTGFTSEQINAANNSKQNKIGWAYIIMASTTILMTIGGIIINILLILRTKLQEKIQNLNNALKEQQPNTSQDYEISRKGDSKMIQNKSEVSVTNQKSENYMKVQDYSSQEIVKEITLEELTPYNLNSYKQIILQQNKQESPSNPLVEIEEEKKDYEVLTPLEQFKFDKMTEIFQNMQADPPKKKKNKPSQNDVLAAKGEIFSMLKTQSELAKIVYDLAQAIPKDN